ncbi:MAG: hypothetical protein KF799_13500 [Bdellovibrionales bacterium]|nr:hypothetical protein [Bdellovibrionales bacterium]
MAQSIKTFAITWTGAPTSWDPLNFDAAANIFTARMLYATPLEISAAGILTSRLLNRFSVSPDSKQIDFSIKPNQIFADGNPITAEDIATSIVRMAMVRPRFPVLENIEGLHEWLQLRTPLNSFPKGIEVSQGRIRIRLTKAEDRPLLRFTLEPFAVIPRSCIDLNANKLSCERPSESGPYNLEVGGIGSEELVFKKRMQESIPDRIRFRFPKALALMAEIAKPEASETVFFANDLDFSGADLTHLRSNYAFLPTLKAWHGRFLLNPLVAPFNEQICRQIFADRFREIFAQLNLLDHRVEASIFTRLTPGYQDWNQMRKSYAGSNPQDYLNRLKGVEFKWARRGAQQPAFAEAIATVCADLDMLCTEVCSNEKSVRNLLDDGVSLISGSTGFWPLDVLGDLQMLFTPNMHKHLSTVAENDQLQKAIRTARLHNGKLSALHDINRILYDDAIYNVYTHHQYFYVVHKEHEKYLRGSPIGVTIPYPWQVFR